MGGASRAHVLMDEGANYCRVEFRALQRKGSRRTRLAELRKVLRSAGIRWPEKKAHWLTENFERVTNLGGPKKARSLLLGCGGRDAMIEFWRQFKGLHSSDKYARNIMMDCYHPDFRDCIAVDARIKRISRALGLSFQTYEEEENFYLDVAKSAALEGWALDRMMYGFRDCILDALEDACEIDALRRALRKKHPFGTAGKKLDL